jgi:hypothetical protein
VRDVDVVVTLGREARVEPVPGTRFESWDTDKPSERGIDGIERMRLVRDDIAARVADLHPASSPLGVRRQSAFGFEGRLLIFDRPQQIPHLGYVTENPIDVITTSCSARVCRPLGVVCRLSAIRAWNAKALRRGEPAQGFGVSF